jgi:hypothetical protein
LLGLDALVVILFGEVGTGLEYEEIARLGFRPSECILRIKKRDHPVSETSSTRKLEQKEFFIYFSRL